MALQPFSTGPEEDITPGYLTEEVLWLVLNGKALIGPNLNLCG